MRDSCEKRQLLALELIYKLNDIISHIKNIMDDLGDSSNEFLCSVYQHNTDKINEKVELFNKNVERVKEINLEITKVKNQWYAFIKNEKELQSLLFPFKLALVKKSILSKTKELKAEITSIGIKNRLIREDIIRLESDMELEATRSLKKDIRYEDYLSHLKAKSLIVSELKYLLPTLSNVNIRELDVDKLDNTIIILNSK